MIDLLIRLGFCLIMFGIFRFFFSDSPPDVVAWIAVWLAIIAYWSKS